MICAGDSKLAINNCTKWEKSQIEWSFFDKTKYALNYKIKQELNNLRIVALPRYDEDNDTFVPFAEASADLAFNWEIKTRYSMGLYESVFVNWIISE